MFSTVVVWLLGSPRRIPVYLYANNLLVFYANEVINDKRVAFKKKTSARPRQKAVVSNQTAFEAVATELGGLPTSRAKYPTYTW